MLFALVPPREAAAADSSRQVPIQCSVATRQAVLVLSRLPSSLIGIHVGSTLNVMYFFYILVSICSISPFSQGCSAPVSFQHNDPPHRIGKLLIGPRSMVFNESVSFNLRRCLFPHDIDLMKSYNRQCARLLLSLAPKCMWWSWGVSRNFRKARRSFICFTEMMMSVSIQPATIWAVAEANQCKRDAMKMLLRLCRDAPVEAGPQAVRRPVGQNPAGGRGGGSGDRPLEWRHLLERHDRADGDPDDSGGQRHGRGGDGAQRGICD